MNIIEIEVTVDYVSHSTKNQEQFSSVKLYVMRKGRQIDYWIQILQEFNF